MIQYFPTITGSLTVNGDLIVTGTGSMSASLALNSNLLQGTGSTGFATTASLTAVSSSQQQISASLLNVVANYATTGSNSFRADQSITGSLVVSSTITAQTLVVQTVTSSIVYSSGSNLFGNALSNTQTFTGSLNVTGSLVLIGNITGNAVTLTGALVGTSASFSSYGYFNGANGQYAAASRGLVEVDGAASSVFGLTVGNVAKAYLYTTAIETLLKGYGNLILQAGNYNALTFTGSTGAATFISSATATQFNVSASGGTTQIYNTGGGHTVITNATANKDMNYQTSGTGGHYFNTAGVDRLIISSTGAATFSGSVTMGGDLVLTPNDSAISFSSGAARFFTGGQEKMRITSGNDVGIGATTITNPNSIGRVLEVKLANSVGIVLNDSRDASPIGLENRGAVFHLTYGTKSLLVSDGGSGNIAIGISAAYNGERLRVGGSTSANKPAMAITSANPNVSCPNGTATTVYTFPSYPRVMFYMVFVRFDTGADANGYAAYAVVAASSVGSKLMTVVNGSAAVLTLSGLNVQINQTSGVTQNAVVSVIQIFAEAGGN